MSIDKTKIAKSYIVNFYNDVIALTKLCPQYKNLILELKHKGINDDFGEADDQVKGTIVNAVSQVRNLVETTYINYETITDNNENLFKKEAKIKTYYEKLEQDYILDRKDLFEYVLILNKFIGNDIIENIISMSQSTEVFDDNE